LVHQHLAGIPAQELSKAVTNPELRLWWRNYLESRPMDLPLARYPEVKLAMPCRNHRLVAQYDLVAVDAGRRLVIVDWKTSRKRPERKRLLGRLQTHVYPYLLVEAGALLNKGESIRPRQVTMIYWFTNFPAVPGRFDYDRDEHRADRGYLSRLVAEIEERFEGLNEHHLLPCGNDESRCQYCRYRSFCERGVEAGLLDEMAGEAVSEDPFDFEIDFEQIAELEYG
jgi:CRISPR/Cas system-associated exonuclease Cas4 (RecB family)